MSILEKINGHSDLDNLSGAQREQLCREIREFLVSHIAKTGGHLASNLGVVELSVAIETVYNTNIDRLVFDVGHQSYVHKLLTGRRADFDRLRQFGGIAGFPKPSESDSDAFVAGHASSSVSVALGMARARTLSKENYNVIALLGDGAVGQQIQHLGQLHQGSGTGSFLRRFRIAGHGDVLEAGETILAGSFTRPMWVYKGDTVFADYGPLGTITCRFE